MKALLRVALPLAALLTSTWLPAPASAGPAIRRVQERKACKELASKLQAASGNPQQAQVIYQQGVLKLIEKFGENPCGDIPAPTATVPNAAPAPGTTPAATTAAPGNSQQTQACQQFAAKLQTAQGNPAQAQQIYASGSQKLSSLYGPDPCPNVPKP